ncbi:MAG TPA: HAMP domain-containing sensor histidine kinase, partial [Ardenticatenaceae bacterium]|nr:HAMP domain-containing sensor histidine kinase [Ardenticatenaceae bacterium]
HELRTPLVSVRGYADMLTTGRLGPLSDKQRHAVEVLRRNIDRLIHIIEKILTYSALENEQIPLQFQSVNLNTALASVARLNQPATGEQGVTIELDLPAEPVTIEADPHHLATLFHQLVSNAVKFNNPAGRVIIGARQVDDTAEVVIGDTGIGIPPERLNKIFERFYQVDNSRTRRYGGLGLGLAIAHRIVTLHGGTISVQSEAETGSTFTVLLPVQRGASATLEAAAAEGVRTEH